MEVQVLFRAPIFLLLFFNSTNSHAEIQVIKTDEELVLQSNNCSQLKNELAYFLDLSKNYEGTNKKISIDCRDRSFNLSKILPKKMLNLLNNNSQYYGPNCWNSVLIANNILPSIRFTKSEEIEFVYKNFCKKIKNFSEVSTGNVFRIFNEHQEDFHSFVYISPNFSFSKNGPETKSSYQLMNTNQVFEDYGIHLKCFDEKNKMIKECFDKIEVYSCNNFKLSASFVLRFSGIIMMIEELEHSLGHFLQHYRDFSDQNKRIFLSRQLQQNQKTLMFIVSENLNDFQDSVEDKLEMEFLYLRLDSIAEQLSFF